MSELSTARREMLKSMLYNMINDDTDKAASDMHSYMADKMREVAGLVPVKENEDDDDDEASDQDYQKAKAIVASMAGKLDQLLGKKINRSDLDAFMFGGGDMGDLLDDLIKIGYDDGGSSYADNKEFWGKVGVSKADLDQVVKASE